MMNGENINISQKQEIKLNKNKNKIIDNNFILPDIKYKKPFPLNDYSIFILNYIFASRIFLHMLNNYSFKKIFKKC